MAHREIETIWDLQYIRDGSGILDDDYEQLNDVDAAITHAEYEHPDHDNAKVNKLDTYTGQHFGVPGITYTEGQFWYYILPVHGYYVGYKCLQTHDSDDGISLSNEDYWERVTMWADAAGFRPIGTEANRFTGSYNGQNFEIQNLYINRPALNYVGLFGDAFKYNAGEQFFSNVKIVSAEVIGGDRVGCLVGMTRADTDPDMWGNAGGVSNCHVFDSTVVGNVNVGGLGGNIAFGYVSNNAHIRNCTVKNTNVSGKHFVGLFSGVCGGPAAMVDPEDIESYGINCHVIGGTLTVLARGAERRCGAFTGVPNGCRFKNCSCAADAVVINADAENPELRFGGFGGTTAWGNWMEDCFARVKSFTNNQASGTQRVGGFIGYVFHTSGGLYSKGKYTKCYAQVAGVENFIHSLQHDGQNEADAADSYYEVADASANPTSFDAVGMEAADMKNKNSYTGWNFDDVWVQRDYWNDEYPYLRSLLTDADLPEKATTPTPLHEAEDVELDPDGELTLEWVAGDRTDTFNLYLGSELIAEDLDAATTEEVVELLYGTEYDWRVDTVNPAGVTEGDVWSFEVKPALSMGPITYEWVDDTMLMLSAGTVTGHIGDRTYTWHEYVDGSWTERLSGVDEFSLTLTFRDQEETYRFRLTVTDEGLGNEETVRFLTVGQTAGRRGLLASNLMRGKLLKGGLLGGNLL